MQSAGEKRYQWSDPVLDAGCYTTDLPSKNHLCVQSGRDCYGLTSCSLIGSEESMPDTVILNMATRIRGPRVELLLIS